MVGGALTMPTNNAFPDPFPTNHCVVMAFAHARHAAIPMIDPRKGDPTEFALDLAKLARKAGRLSRSGRSAMTYDSRDWWALHSGLKVVRALKYRRARFDGVSLGGPGIKVSRSLRTLKRWAREHPKGTFVVITLGHMQAVVNGTIYGYYKPRSLVLSFIQLESE